MDIPTKDLDIMKTEDDALDQSIALNRIVMTMLESKRREDLWLRIILIVSILVNLIICIVFVQYEKHMTTETITTTVEQDTGEGSGNNVFQSGESAKYIQGDSEEVIYGETTSNNNQDDQDVQLEQGNVSDEVEPIG